MLRVVWRGLGRFMPAGRAGIVRVTITSLVASFFEAATLVVIVTVALGIAEGTGTVTMDLPLFGERAIDPELALAVAGVAAGLSLLLHVDIASVTAQLTSSTLEETRRQGTRAFAHATWSRQAEEREGALQQTVGALASSAAGLVTQLANLLVAAAGLAALLVTALLVDAAITALVLVVGAALFLVVRPVARATRRRAGRFVQTDSAFSEEVAAWASTAMDQRVFGVVDQRLGQLWRANRAVARAQRRARFLARLGTSLYKDLALIVMVGAVGVMLLGPEADLAAVGAIVLLVVRCLGYATQVQSALQSLNEVGPNLELITERIDRLDGAVEVVGARPLEMLGPVELRDVTYEYFPGRRGIEEVMLRLDPGESIGVIGPSGSGKSTLVQTLLRLRQPTSGSVLVSGVPYEEIDPQHWARLVTLVPQEPSLFAGTVFDNIAYGRDWVGSEDVEQAARRAHVLDELLRLPEGLRTRLGPRGTGLSGGQKQRLAIARALAGAPQLLVLDEPTSALDGRSESLLLETIRELMGEVTLVIVAHRLSTIATCDRIIELRSGRLVRSGSPAEMLPGISSHAAGSEAAG